MAILGSAWFVLGEVGVQQSWEVISADSTNITADTEAALSYTVSQTDPSFVDRVVVATMALTIITGLGIATAGARGNPKIVNQVLRYFPLVGLAIGVLEFSEIAQDMLSMEYTFDNYTDAENAKHIAVVGWVLSGATRLFSNRR